MLESSTKGASILKHENELGLNQRQRAATELMRMRRDLGSVFREYRPGIQEAMNYAKTLAPYLKTISKTLTAFEGTFAAFDYIGQTLPKQMKEFWIGPQPTES